jgi:hypothetical protein
LKWFQHDSDASLDFKVKKLIRRHGATGYAVYIHCLELIALSISKDNPTLMLEHDNETIADNLKIDNIKVVDNIINTIVELNLFQRYNDNIYCYKMAERLDNTESRNPDFNRVKKEVRSYYVATTKKQRADEMRRDEIRTEEKRKDKKRIDEIRKVDKSTLFKCRFDLVKKGLPKLWCKGANNWKGMKIFHCPRDETICLEWFNRFTNTTQRECLEKSLDFKNKSVYIPIWINKLKDLLANQDSWLYAEIKANRNKAL